MTKALDLAQQLRQFRLESQVAASRMPWRPEVPLDRLLDDAADELEALSKELEARGKR